MRQRVPFFVLSRYRNRALTLLFLYCCTAPASLFYVKAVDKIDLVVYLTPSWKPAKSYLFLGSLENISWGTHVVHNGWKVWARWGNMRHSFGKENREAEGLKVPYAKLVRSRKECFSYTESRAERKKFRSLRVLTEAAFQILFGGSLSSLSLLQQKSFSSPLLSFHL